jgi:hypothetical protein
MTLEGIEILHQKEIMEFVTPNWVLPVAVLIGILCIVMGWLLVDMVLDMDCGILLGLFVGVICGLVIMLGGSEKVPTGRYKYEATIDKSVSFVELYEHYDIVEQRGEIYILKDKETTKNEQK